MTTAANPNNGLHFLGESIPEPCFVAGNSAAQCSFPTHAKPPVVQPEAVVPLSLQSKRTAEGKARKTPIWLTVLSFGQIKWLKIRPKRGFHEYEYAHCRGGRITAKTQEERGCH